MIKDRLKHVERLFMNVQRDLYAVEDFSVIRAYIEGHDPDFRSLVAESASMLIAERSLSEGDLGYWREFMDSMNDLHLFHMLIGMGMAMGKCERWPNDKSGLSQKEYALCLDGIGYYFALFRGRATVKQAGVPRPLVSDDQYWFDSGVGRRLWYLAEGSVDKLLRYLAVFEKHRQDALWQGIGIAFAYVSGGDKKQVLELLRLASTHSESLKRGLGLGIVSRVKAGAPLVGLNAISELIFGKSANELHLNIPIFEF